MLILLGALLAVGAAAGAGAKLRPNGRIVWVSDQDFSGQEIPKGVALEIYSMVATGGDVRRLTHDRHNDEYPAASPNGRKIAFVDESLHSGTRWSHIVVMNANGTGAHNISGVHGGDTQPSWSPDGRRIAFSNQGVWVMNANGTGRRQIVTPKGNPVWTSSPVSWSPDGKAITFQGTDPDSVQGTDGTWSIGVDGTGARLLAAGVRQPRLSPDGRKLVGVDRSGMVIVIVDLRSGARRRLTSHVIATSPAWSPDGRKIVYASSYFQTRTPYGEITTMNADGSDKRRLTNNSRDDIEPVWAAR